MRFEKGHKETTRQQIIDVASRRFRRYGVSASGLAGIMTEAGLTNGAFYPHFKSKDELVREALAAALSSQHDALNTEGTAPDIESAIRHYLNIAHIAGSSEGCPSAALLPEIGRQPTSTRQVYEDELRSFVASLADRLPDAGSEAASRRAMAIFALMTGSLQLARAVPDETLAADIIEGGVEAALRLAQVPAAAA